MSTPQQQKRLVYQYCWSLIDRLVLALALIVIGLELMLLGKDTTDLAANWLPVMCLTGSISALLFLLLVRKQIFSANNLYERIRTTVAETYLQSDKLKDWQNRKRDIHTLDELYAQVNDMLDSIGDFYTCLTSPELLANISRGKGLPDFGITCGIARDGKQLLIFDADGNLLPEQDLQGYPLVCSVLFESAGYQTGLRIGDVLLSLDGKSCANQSLSKIYNLGKERRVINIVYKRGVKEFTTVLDTHLKPTATAITKHLGNVGYLRLENFDHITASRFKGLFQNLEKCRALILDLRGNRGGDIRNALLLLSAFLDTGVLVQYQKRFKSAELQQLQFRLTDREVIIELQSNGIFTPLANQPPLPRLPNLSQSRPTVVLIDNCSMSGAELLSGALKDYNRAHLIGNKTFGKGVGQDVHQIPPCIKVSVTSMKFTTPKGIWPGDGALTVANGIEPHEVVLAAPGDAFGSPKDQVLDRALKYLGERIS